MKKVNITTKIQENITDFIKKINPESKKSKTKKEIPKVQDFLRWLICWQECYLNTIFENTKHYKDKQKEFESKKRKKTLSKSAWIEKLSWYLLFTTTINRIKQSYFKYLNKTITKVKTYDEMKKVNGMNIKDRVYNQLLRIHDTTDIQKPTARKMEKVSKTRDWSEHISWKWYYIEWTIISRKNKIIPFLLTLFSSEEKKYITPTCKYADSKEVSKENMKQWKQCLFLKAAIDVFDRWYDIYEFMKWLKNDWKNFIIRWIKNGSVIDIEYFDKIKHKLETQMDRNNIWYRVEEEVKELKYSKQEWYDWFEVWFKKVYRKWNNFDKDVNDYMKLNLVSVRITSKDIKAIEEDLNIIWDDNKNTDRKFEREIYFFTNLEVDTIEDAIVIFKLYLKRWKIETWFKYMKQVFGLEKIKLLKFEKIKNFCNLLVIATYYFYDKFNLIKSEIEFTKWSLEESMSKREQKKEKKQWKQKKQYSKEELFISFILKYYLQYCMQKWLKQTVDSFTKFIFHEMWDIVLYSDDFDVKSYLNSW